MTITTTFVILSSEQRVPVTQNLQNQYADAGVQNQETVSVPLNWWRCSLTSGRCMFCSSVTHG